MPQNLMEFWVVITRPQLQNGFGLSTAEAQREIERLTSLFTLLPETEQIYPEWQRLVVDHKVSGKQAHDARLVAAMKVHGIDSILTFDRTGFSRYQVSVPSVPATSSPKFDPGPPRNLK